MVITNEEVGRDIQFTVLAPEGNRGQYWHDTLTILFVLSGVASVSSARQHFDLEQEDIWVVGQFIPYTLQMSPEALVLCMHINTMPLRAHGNLLAGVTVRCCSAEGALTAEDRRQLDRVRGLVAGIFTACYKNESGSRLEIYRETLALLRCLEGYFSVPSSADDVVGGDMQRLRRVLEYIRDNYARPITLEEIAASEYLSTGYFSRFFTSHVGQSFTQYLKTVRMGHAYLDICSTEKSITAVAMDSGFPNVNTFIASFRDRYGKTPGEYRKGVRLRQRARREERAEESPVSDAFRPLAKYLTGPGELHAPPPARAVQYTDIPVDCRGKTKPFPHTWQSLLTVGWAKEVLLAPVQEQIRQCQREIGFEYIRFHGLLDDDMIVYRENSRGEPVYNFTYVDMLFDFILSVGLLPYVELSYMPSALARDNRDYFEHGSVVSMPKDMDLWRALVARLVRHWIGRYGLREVSRWKFVTMNAYCAYLGLFTMDEFNGLYAATYGVIKDLAPRAQVGGPGCDLGALGLRGNRDWEIFFDFCQANGCTPDFVSVQCFHAEFKDSAQAVWAASSTHETPPAQLSPNPDYLRDALGSLRALLRRRDIRRPRIVLETWNSTMWQRDLCNDTCFKAAFLAKNILANCDRLEGMGYWTLSDFMEELPVDQDLFHGGYGLFTYNGIPKSGYNALHMLHRLGDTLLERGDTHVVTSKDGKYRIMAFNYCHYDQLYLQQYVARGDKLDRYQVFAAHGDLHLRFRLTGLAPGQYEVETYSVSRDGGSAFDAWVDMGAPNELRPTRQEHLKSIAAPVYRVSRQTAINGAIEIELTLRPHQVITAVAYQL